MGRVAHLLCVRPCARICPHVGFLLRVIGAESVWTLSFITCVTLGEMFHHLASLRLRVFIYKMSTIITCPV